MKAKKLFDTLIFFFLSLTFVFLAVGQLGRISFLGQQINGYLYEVPAVITLALLAIKGGIVPLREAWNGYKSVFFFFAIAFCSFAFSFFHFDGESNGIAVLYLGRLLFYFLFFFYLLSFLKKRKNATKTLCYGIAVFAGLTAVFSIIQYIWYPELRNLLYLGWDPHLYRMFGTFLDTSFAAGIYSLCFFFIFFYGRSFISRAYLYYLFLGVFLLCVLLTFSRATYLIFFLSFLGVMFAAKRYRLSALVLGCAVVVLVLVPKPQGEGVNLLRTFSVESRLVDYQNAIHIWTENPLLGYGYNHLRAVKHEHGLIDDANYEITHAGASFHSSFLVILTTMGIIGLGAFLWMGYEFARKGKHTLFFVLFVAFLSLADNILLQPLVLFLFFCVMAYDIAVSHPSDRLR